MTTAYSDDQIAEVARAGGFTGDSLVTAVAIALAESQGNPYAHNATGRDDSYSLWQVNMFGNLGPTRRARYGLASNDELYDPVTNAQVAYDISKQGQSFGAWSTYTNGMYRRFLDRAQAAVAASSSGRSGAKGGFPIPTPNEVVRGIGNAITDPKGAVLGVGNAVTDPKGTVGTVLFGGVADDIRKVGIYLLVVGTGLGLLALGAWRSTSGARAEVSEAVEPAASMAAKGAML